MSVNEWNSLPLSSVSQRRRKRMRVEARLHPWRDSWEVDDVGRSLLAAIHLVSPQGSISTERIDQATQASLLHALHTVAMWKIRSAHGRIPHSMESTFLLAQILWRDAQASTMDHSSFVAPSSMELRLAYASALLRGVNGLADAAQQHRAMAASVSSLCEYMGLPGWLVEIRHEAAHNDLPSLPALRLAANTFLGYLQARYWTPLANARWEGRNAAVQRLTKYDAASNNLAESIVDGKIHGNEGPSGDNPLNQEDGANVSDNSEDSSSDDDDGMWGSKLGTSQNRYAALFDAPKPKPSKPVKVKEAPPKEVVEVKPRTITLSHHAKEFVKNVPIDVGYHVALSYLVWGGVGDVPLGSGVLQLGKYVEGSFDTLRQRFRPLILCLCRAWPGFMHALLVHLVDCILSIETAILQHDDRHVDLESKGKVSLLSSWIRYILSREFHVHHDRTVALIDETCDLTKKATSTWTERERRIMKSPAPLRVLGSAGLPIKALSSRFSEMDVSLLTEESQALATILTAILNDGDNPTVYPWSDTAASDNSCVDGGLSITEMEAMLASDSLRPIDQPSALNEPTSLEADISEDRVWLKCKSWDACAIGNLPGYPG